MLSRGFPRIEMLHVVLIFGLAAAAALSRAQSRLTRITGITSLPTSMMRLDHASYGP